MSCESPVKVYVYDLSNGIAKQLSMLLTGKQIDGIWHTSVVVYGKEYYFGQGVKFSTPGQTQYGTPIDIIDVGTTNIPEGIVEEMIGEMGHSWTGDKYHLLSNNCNTFTQELVQMLTGSSVPSYITDLPDEFLSTPIGKSFVPIIDSFYGNPSSNSSQGAVSHISSDLNNQSVRSSGENNSKMLETNPQDPFYQISSNSEYSSFKNFLAKGNAGLLVFTTKDQAPKAKKTIEEFFTTNGISINILFNFPKRAPGILQPKLHSYLEDESNSTSFALAYVDSNEVLETLNQSYNIKSNPAILFFSGDIEISRVYDICDDVAILSGLVLLSRDTISSEISRLALESSSYCVKSIPKFMELERSSSLLRFQSEHGHLKECMQESLLKPSDMSKEMVDFWVNCIEKHKSIRDGAIQSSEIYYESLVFPIGLDIINLVKQTEYVFLALKSGSKGSEGIALTILLNIISRKTGHLTKFNLLESSSAIKTVVKFINDQVEDISALSKSTASALLQLITELLSVIKIFISDKNSLQEYKSPIIANGGYLRLNSNSEEVDLIDAKRLFTCNNFLTIFAFDLCTSGSKLVTLGFLEFQNLAKSPENTNPETNIQSRDDSSTILLMSCSECLFYISTSIYLLKGLTERVFNSHKYQLLLPLVNKSEFLKPAFYEPKLETDMKKYEPILVELVCAIVEILGETCHAFNDIMGVEVQTTAIINPNESEYFETNPDKTTQDNTLSKNGQGWFLVHLLISLGILLHSDLETLVELANALETADILSQLTTPTKTLPQTEAKAEPKDNIASTLAGGVHFLQASSRAKTAVKNLRAFNFAWEIDSTIKDLTISLEKY